MLLDFRRQPHLLERCVSVLSMFCPRQIHLAIILIDECDPKSSPDAPFVIFQTANCLKEGVVSEFNAAAPDLQQSLQQYLIDYLIHHQHSLSNSVQQQLFQAFGILMKMKWPSLSVEARSEFIGSTIPRMLESPTHRELAIQIILGLIQEFSSTKSSHVGLTLEFHENCRLSLQSFGLRELIEIVLAAMDSTSEPSRLAYLCISVIEAFLGWNFSNETQLFQSDANIASGSGNGSENSGGSITLRLPQQFGATIINPNFLALFFRTLRSSAGHDAMEHKIEQCMVQLASVDCSVFTNDQQKLAYASQFLDMIHERFAIAKEPPNVLSLCQMWHRLAANFRFSSLCRLPRFTDHMQLLIHQASSAIQRAVQDPFDDTWNMEIFDELLETWTLLVHQLEQLPGDQSAANAELMRNGSRIIVESYIKARIAGRVNDGEEDDDEEFMEDGKDCDTFEDQLISIGTLARMDIVAVLSFLGRQLNEQLSLVRQHLANHPGQLTVAFEKTHWTLLIAGHAIADAGIGETPTIPQAISVLSNGETLSAIVNAVLDTLSWLANCGCGQNASPLAVETLFWFLQRWSRTYLFFDCASDSGDSAYWQQVYGSQSPSSHSLMAALIAAVRSFLFLYSAEAEVSIAIVAVLEALVKNRGICAFLVGPASQACWLPLVDLVTKQLHTLPDLAHCPLVAVFIRVGSGFADSPEQQRAYVYLTLGMIGNRWENLLGRPDFQQIFQQPSVIVQLQNCLDMFSGVADAMELNNQTLLFEFCSKYFDSMHSCLVLYKNAQEIEECLMTFWELLTKRIMIESLTATHRHQYLHAIVQLLAVFTKSESGKKRLEADEERFLDDVLLVLRILLHLIDGCLTVEAAILNDVTDTVMAIVEILLPLLTPDVLSDLRVVSEFMKFVNGFISSQPQKFVSHGNQKALTAILQSLQFGLNHGSHEVSVAALESIFSLSQCFLGAQQSSLPPAYAELFQKSAGECISIFLYGTYDVALIEPTGSNTLFVLILVCGLPFFNSQLHAIAEKIMQRQSAGGFFHDSDKERLLQAFAVFSNDTSQVISLANQSNQRECRRKFQKILVTWLEKIRGLVTPTMMANSFSNPEQTGLFNSSGVSQILASALLATSNSPTTVEFHEEDIIHPEGVENAIGGLRLPLMGEEHAISPEVKDFIRRLYSMLNEKSLENIVTWQPSGKSFRVRDLKAFTNIVLPKYYRHSNFTSFTRQLNKYKFRKVKRGDPEYAKSESSSKTEYIYWHPLFIRNRPELLISVQRGQINESEQKAATAEINSSEPMDTTATDWHEKTHQQATVSEKVESRTESVQVLTEPNVAMEIEEPALPSPAAAAVQAESNESRPQQPQRSAKRTAPPRSSRRRKHSNSSGQDGSDHEAELESKLEELRTVHKQMTKALRQMTNNYHLAAKEILGLHQQLARQEKMIETLINEVAKRDVMLSNSLIASSAGVFPNIRSASSPARQEPSATDSQFKTISQPMAVFMPKRSQSRISELAGSLTSLQPELTTIKRLDHRGKRVAPVWKVAPRVLLVEDDPTCRKLSGRLLQLLGCKYDVATDGLAAVTRMNLDKYDIVLMDIMLPNLDGVSATHHIRQFDKRTPIISMTSNTTETDCNTYFSTGMTDILAKPFSRDNFFDILERYCFHLTNQYAPSSATAAIYTGALTTPKSPSPTTYLTLPGGSSTSSMFGGDDLGGLDTAGGGQVLLEANDPSRYFATIATPQEWLNAMSELGLGFVLDETAHGSIISGNNTNSSRFIEASGGGNSDDDDDNNNNNDDEDDGLIDVDFGDNSADLQQLIASSNDGDINLPAITTTSISH